MNAGFRLKGILQEEKCRVEDVESEETDESEVDTEDMGTSGPGKFISLPSPSQCCTICFAGVSTGDIMVNCHAPQCTATAYLLLCRIYC